MEKKLHWNDHKSTNISLVRTILIGSEILTIGVLAFIYYMSGSEFQEEDYGSFFIVGVFMLIFFGLPHLIMALTNKPKETIFDLETKTIHWYDRKKEIKSLPFQSINSISYSEYSYTVNTKNGTRTVRVYTVVGHTSGETIQLIEGTNFSKTRFDGEVICKHLQVPLQTVDGTTLSPAELDLPIHKRNLPKQILDSEINFSPNSKLTIKKSNQEITLKSEYNPRIILFVVLCVSFALSLILHFVFGDVFELSLSYWQEFPPSIYQILFLVFSFGLGFFPYLYVIYQQKRLKEITISKTMIKWYGKEYLYGNWEDILQMENRLCLVNDKKMETFSLFYFCENSDITNVRYWILKNIFEVSGGDLNLARFE
ncbi:hypothetical protein AB3N60_09345 [Leptospira sp. WS39.C2]